MIVPRLFVAALLAATALATLGCEHKAIGRICDPAADAGSNEAVVSGQAVECPTRICVRPAVDVQIAASIDTSSLCSAECAKDSDCDSGEPRSGNNTADRRCKSGFVCGVATVVGTFGCKKLCVCKDFLVDAPTRLEVRCQQPR